MNYTKIFFMFIGIIVLGSIAGGIMDAVEKQNETEKKVTNFFTRASDEYSAMESYPKNCRATDETIHIENLTTNNR